jgi:Cyclic nucleotide-binding domain
LPRTRCRELHRRAAGGWTVSLSPTGKEVVLNVIHAGEVFGEIAVIDGEERSAGAAAMTDLPGADGEL